MVVVVAAFVAAAVASGDTLADLGGAAKGIDSVPGVWA